MSSETSGNPVVAARGLTRKFGAKTAIDCLDLQIDAGILVGLIGPNGAGKTTFMNLLLGLIEPGAGQIEVLGHPARALPEDVACRIVGVGDRHEPPRAARLIDLIRLQREASPLFDEQLALQLLLDRRQSPEAVYGGLSKGQRRWALAACAIACRPAVLILDEPADGLDPETRRQLYDHLRALVNDHGATVVVASHILADLERVADDVVIMHNGRVRLHESLESLRDQVREVEIGAGAPRPAWLDDCEILAGSSSAAGQRLWVRCWQEELAGTARGAEGLAVRHANLESLYLAVTKPPDRRAPEALGKESALCL